jgi:phosphatidylglycerophosphate synthase
MIRKNLANIISAVRILLAPLLVYLLVAHHRNAFFIVSMIGMVTDMIDGTVARMYSGSTPLGQQMDSIADVLFIPVYAAGSIILLRLYDVIPWPLIAIPIVLAVLVKFICARLITGKIVLLHVGSWQFATNFFTFFVIVSLLFGVSEILYYCFFIISIYALIEEMGIYIRDRGNVDPTTHSYFGSRKAS